MRRFGWSDASAAEAQASAQQRADEALQRLLAGEKLLRREPKIAYNGADGVPIREEILSRHGDAVITRNAYGARCLNSPNVLFADIDFPEQASGPVRLIIGMVLLSVAALAWPKLSGAIAGVIAFLFLLLFPSISKGVHALVLRIRGGAEKIAIHRIHAFLQRNRDWNVRVYRTPAGLRVLALHATFSPADPAVAAFFRALGVDEVYARMCRNQQCFRARLSAKPWRIGIASHLRPRPGVWPINARHLPVRAAWVDAYERAAAAYAACRLLATLGSGTVDAGVGEVLALHDAQCRATSGLPIA